MADLGLAEAFARYRRNVAKESVVGLRRHPGWPPRRQPLRHHFHRKPRGEAIACSDSVMARRRNRDGSATTSAATSVPHGGGRASVHRGNDRRKDDIRGSGGTSASVLRERFVCPG